MAAVAKSEVDLIALDKNKATEASIVKKLRLTIEGYTNGGLNEIETKLEENEHAFLDASSFLNELVQSKENKIDFSRFSPTDEIEIEGKEGIVMENNLEKNKITISWLDHDEGDSLQIEVLNY